MNLEKADYFVIAQFGNLDLILQKLNLENKNIDDIKNVCNKNHISLFEQSLIFRNFDISNYLLENKVKLNVISNENRNELHYIAANINNSKAIKITKYLIDQSVDLNLQDKEFGNTPFWYLCLETMKVNSEELFDLIQYCLTNGAKFDIKNKKELSILNLVHERKNKIMQKLFEGVN
ncbi:hypothetical protein CKN80_03780 [Carnobacterium divergens]|uniref:ankyrin repeat domain-containing protein n=1 Tax=Carnobacterium divergens TaxID=2748 RepID=UPI0010722D43|nr:ankyrin repeat domain-containing protein [Carnobacterium divergens]TFJ46867.1 hypothetical protein CKN79_03775 [Carnobacterium divergens]TFJ53831.1 hypothetical protein CKN80_03780 [Carnobacterium divergens]